MTSRTSIFPLAVILAIGLASGAAKAATVIVEPDNYSGNVSNVAPGAHLSTFRYDGAGGYTFHRVYSVEVGPWAPTGKRVFGHRTVNPSETAHHWDYLAHAYECEHDGVCFANFYAFRVDFKTPTRRASVLTTMRGEMAMDGAEVWAFNRKGERIQRCRVGGVDLGVLQSGILPDPQYVNAQGQGSGVECGTVIEQKNCDASPSADPGACDFVVSLNVRRRRGDIAYIWFGGVLFQNTYAPVDRLTYEYIAP